MKVEMHIWDNERKMLASRWRYRREQSALSYLEPFFKAKVVSDTHRAFIGYSDDNTAHLFLGTDAWSIDE